MSAGKIWLLTFLSLGLVAVYSNLDASNRLSFAGKVHFAGKPLVQGVVLLYPEKGTESEIIALRVQGGQFEIDEESGPVPGEYKVEIYETNGSGVVETIPKKFNTQSILKLNLPSENHCYAEFEL